VSVSKIADAVKTAVPVVASTGTPSATDPAAGTAHVPVNKPLAYTVPKRTSVIAAWPSELSAVKKSEYVVDPFFAKRTFAIVGVGFTKNFKQFVGANPLDA
jgi:hypothetical protein